MIAVFAKWFLVSTVQLSTGTGIEWPVMEQERQSVGISYSIQVIEEREGGFTPCPGIPNCIIPPRFVIKTRPLFCLERGVYTVNLGVGTLQNSPSSFGRVWLQNATTDEKITLLHWATVPGMNSYDSGSVAVPAESPTCFRVLYDSTSRAYIDPSTTRLTISGVSTQ